MHQICENWQYLNQAIAISDNHDIKKIKKLKAQTQFPIFFTRNMVLLSSRRIISITKPYWYKLSTYLPPSSLPPSFPKEKKSCVLVSCCRYSKTTYMFQFNPINRDWMLYWWFALGRDEKKHPSMDFLAH